MSKLKKEITKFIKIMMTVLMVFTLVNYNYVNAEDETTNPLTSLRIGYTVLKSGVTDGSTSNGDTYYNLDNDYNGDYWSWDADTSTLSLYGEVDLIRADGDLNIEVTDDSSITNDNYKYEWGCITVENGSLNLNITKGKTLKTHDTAGVSALVYVQNDLTVTGCGVLDVYNSLTTRNFGIQVGGLYMLKGSGLTQGVSILL